MTTTNELIKLERAGWDALSKDGDWKLALHQQTPV